MLKRFAALLAVTLIAASLFAGDPWKEKPYKQWDQKDVAKVLNDSPWAKTYTLGGFGGAGQAITLPKKDRDTRDPARAGGEEQSSASETTFYIRWMSAHTMREAQVRNLVLQGTPEEKAEAILAQEQPEYAILIAGRDMSLFAKADEMGLREKSYLMPKKTKTEIAPARVVIHRAPESQKVVVVALYFPKKTASGEAVIASDEKQVEFTCGVGTTTIKVKFDPQKMVSQQGLDL